MTPFDCYVEENGVQKMHASTDAAEAITERRTCFVVDIEGSTSSSRTLRKRPSWTAWTNIDVALSIDLT